MKNFSKTISGILSVCLIAGSLSIPAFAANETALQDEVVYQVMDGKTGEMIDTYQSDIDAGHWNVDALGQDAPMAYDELPMRIASSVNDYAELTVTFEYLKLLQGEDTATITVTDRATGEEYYLADLSESNIVELADLPIGNVYTITLEETFDGATETYTRVMTTQNRRAEMPLNVSLNPIGETEGTQATALEVVEMNKEDVEPLLDEDGNETDITILHERKSEIIAPENLPEYYNTLPSDKLYKVFAGSGSELGRTFSGFISTYPGGRDYDVFKPSFVLEKEEDYDNKAMPFAMTRAGVPQPIFTLSEVISNPHNYTNMVDATVAYDREDGGYGFVVRFDCQPLTNYKIETIGMDVNAEMEIWIADNPKNSPKYEWSVFGEPNPYTTYETIYNAAMYIVIYFPDNNWRGRALFRISPLNAKDQSNSYYDLKQTNKRQPCEKTVSEGIDYLGDVDLYYIDNTLGNGRYPINLRAYSGNYGPITMKLLSEAQSWDTTIMATDYTVDIDANKTKIYSPTLKKGTNYFIQIQPKNYLPNSVGDNYDITIQSPFSRDPREGNAPYYNDDLDHATPISANERLNDVCLHKNDVDCFKFTITEPKVIYTSIFKVNGFLFNLSLYNSSKQLIATGEASGSYNIIEDIKLEPGTYYIQVDNEGLSNEAYMIDASYRLEVDAQDYSAVIDNNVSLSYTAGQTADINGYWNTIIAQASCEVGGYTYKSAQIKEFSKLYIMDGSTKKDLTAANVAALSNGTYNIIMEFFGKAATGSSITLTVTGNSTPVTGEEVVLTTISLETAANPNWYWAACAKMVANSRLTREGSPTSTLAPQVAIKNAFDKTEYLTRVGTIEETAQLASYFYSGNVDGLNFIASAVSMVGIENTMLSTLKRGEAIIARLENSNATTVKYIVIYGVNTGTHQYKVMDPEGSFNDWIDAETLYSGYRGNSGLIFNGQVIECL